MDYSMKLNINVREATMIEMIFGAFIAVVCILIGVAIGMNMNRRVEP